MFFALSKFENALKRDKTAGGMKIKPEYRHIHSGGRRSEVRRISDNCLYMVLWDVDCGDLNAAARESHLNINQMEGYAR